MKNRNGRTRVQLIITPCDSGTLLQEFRTWPIGAELSARSALRAPSRASVNKQNIGNALPIHDLSSVMLLRWKSQDLLLLKTGRQR